MATYGFLGLLDDETIWMNKTLPKPSLNISAYYLEPWESSSFELAGYNWTNPLTGEKPWNTSTPSFTMSNTTYALADVIENGFCQPLGVSRDVLILPVLELIVL